MKKSILLLFIIIPLLIQAQDKGIQFQHNKSWKEVQAKAKAENKYIFMDCFTTWCGPCRYMSSTIFPMENVGQFMNDKFVSVAVQLDTTKNDNEFVKSWYQDGHDIAAKYKVRAYPTYLIFDADGNVVHRFVGSSPAEDFIANAKKSLDPSTQYYTLLNEYNNGKRDDAFLSKMALAAADAYDMDNARKVFNEYLDKQKDKFTKENLDLIKKLTQSSTDKGFDIVLNNPEKVDAALGKGSATSILQPIIMREQIFKYFSNDGKTNPDWTKITAEVTKKYPAQATEAVAKAKVIWYQYKGDWNNYQPAIIDYMKKYGANASPDELNSYAWTVFQNCPNMKCVSEALDWSKRSFESIKNPAFIDTYANILYKLGKKDEALNWEQKAYDLASDSEKKGYQETMDKMKKNEKTWN